MHQHQPKNQSKQTFTALNRQACTVLILNWSERRIQTKLGPTSSTTSEWSKDSHKDLLLTILVKASSHI